jgi:outer membrane protein assembly factor BamB
MRCGADAALDPQDRSLGGRTDGLAPHVANSNLFDRTMTQSRFCLAKIGRILFLAMLAAASWLVGNGTANNAHAVERLLSREEARRLGLERAWFAQVRLDRARHHVERAILTGDRLTVLTSAGVVHEFNALTGETLWIAPVGNAEYPSLGPAANDEYVAVVNGSTLYVLRTKDGKPVLDRQVGGGPGAAPAVADEYVFVPLINGRIEGYPLNQGNPAPQDVRSKWYYQSYGRAMVAPLATKTSFAWSTEKGHFCVGDSQIPAVRFRLESYCDIVAPPAYHNPLFYAGTVDGDLIALHETNGTRQWKFSSGYPILRAPAAVGERVYVTNEEPAMHCVDAKTGHGLWEAMNLTQFAAASRQRVYGFDDLRALVVLDGKTGTLLDRMPTDGTANALVNDQTDRLYLISEDGLLQCLHEIGANKPYYHNPAPAETKPAEMAAETAPSGEAATSDEPAPPTEAESTAPPAEAGEENPFGAANGDAEAPADAPATDSDFGVDENPFGS